MKIKNRKLIKCRKFYFLYKAEERIPAFFCVYIPYIEIDNMIIQNENKKKVFFAVKMEKRIHFR